MKLLLIVVDLVEEYVVEVLFCLLELIIILDALENDVLAVFMCLKDNVLIALVTNDCKREVEITVDLSAVKKLEFLLLTGFLVYESNNFSFKVLFLRKILYIILHLLSRGHTISDMIVLLR